MQILNINYSTTLIQKPLTNTDLFVYSLKKKWLKEVSEIEHYSNETFWRKKDFTRLLKSPNILGYVVVKVKKVLGFVLYKMHKDSVQILNLCVHPEYQNQGIGTILLQRVINIPSSFVDCEIREHNLAAQCLLKKLGFLMTNIKKSSFEDCWPDGSIDREDGYVFNYFKEN